MTKHLEVLFSSQANKAWIAGLVAVLGGYLIPLISDWLTSLTPEAISGWLAVYGVNVPYGLAAVVIGALGVIWTYVIKNDPASKR